MNTLIVVILGAILATSGYGQSQPIGLIMDAKGNVILHRSRAKEKAVEGALLFDQDSLYVPKQCLVRILTIGGDIQEFTRSVRIVRTGLRPHPGVVRILETAETIDRWLPDAEGQLRYRSDSARQLVPTRPRNSAYRTSPDHLEWIGSPRRPFHVSLRCYETDFRWDDTTESNRVELARVARDVQPGQVFHWNVLYSDATALGASVWFRVLTATQLDSLEREERFVRDLLDDTTSAAYRCLQARLLMSFELYDEASVVLSTVQSPANPVMILRARISEAMDYPTEALAYLRESRRGE